MEYANEEARLIAEKLAAGRAKVAEFKAQTQQATQNKLKGYGYDSLCWRYKCAREQQALYEVRGGANPESARKMANRDVMRFCQILDDLIGEHD